MSNGSGRDDGPPVRKKQKLDNGVPVTPTGVTQRQQSSATTLTPQPQFMQPQTPFVPFPSSQFSSFQFSSFSQPTSRPQSKSLVQRPSPQPPLFGQGTSPSFGQNTPPPNFFPFVQSTPSSNPFSFGQNTPSPNPFSFMQNTPSQNPFSLMQSTPSQNPFSFVQNTPSSNPFSFGSNTPTPPVQNKPSLSSPIQSPQQNTTPNLAFPPILSTPSNQNSTVPNVVSTPPVDFSKMDLHDSVNKSGLWQMTGKRLDAVNKQVSPYVKSKSPSNDMIRIDSVTGSNESWGNSADENVRTQMLRDNRGKMNDQEAEASFNQRSHQATLVWKTGSSTLTQYNMGSDATVPISSHTPGIKNQSVPGTKGALTKEHAHRDILRVDVVKATLEDDKRGSHDVPIVSKLATVQLMMSPKEELMTVRDKVVNSKTPIISQFKDIGTMSDGVGSNFDKFADRVQVVRETEKMHAARNLLISGHRSLVPKGHQDLLEKSGGDVEGAMRLLHAESTSQSPTMTFNTATNSQTDRLDQQSLSQMSKQTVGRPRALSDPRRISAPKFDFKN